MMPLLITALLLLAGVMVVFVIHVIKERHRADEATEIVRRMVDGDPAARLECNGEGARARLYHEINSLASVLGAHADAELQAKVFLKNSIQDISHQLKTPLASLSIYQELLADETLDSESRQHFQALSAQELERMELLVQNLLKITKLDADTNILECRVSSVRELILKTRERFALRASREEKNITVELPDETLVVFCDPIWISEALDNLVKNALDHTQPGDTVTLSGKMTAGEVCLQVTDNGSGIHPEDIYHIFKRFYRSRFAKDKSGIGLGLALVRSIAERHGGIVEVDSTLGKGSCFSIYLPHGGKSACERMQQLENPIPTKM